MLEESRYARYKARCRSFIVKCTCFFLLQIIGIGLYSFVVICPSLFIIAASVKRYGARILFLLIIPLIFIVLAATASLSVKRYGQAVLAFLMGERAIKEGGIAQKSKNTYVVIGSIPEKVKKASYPHLTRPTEFHIREKDCERDFQCGDQIIVVYPASHALNVYSYRQILAIYAFSADETRPADIPGLCKDRKKTAARFVLLTALTSILLLSGFGYLVGLLLRQTFFA